MKMYITNGPYRNFEKAVNDIISLKHSNPERPIIALYSQIWETVGNSDGKGYIDYHVNRAVNEGIIWVNAVGNYGKSAYTDKVEIIDEKGSLKLPLYTKYLPFKVVGPIVPVKIVLGWNDFLSDYYNYRASQDLDLILYDSNGDEMGRANLVQDGRDHGGEEGYSRFAREIISATLKEGTYYLGIVAKSNNFDSESRFWVTIGGGDGIKMDYTNGDKIVFMPASNANVLAVGGYDIEYGNSGDSELSGSAKPDILTASIVEFSNGPMVQGTSTSAAVAAGALALYLHDRTSADMYQVFGDIARGRLSQKSYDPSGAPILVLPPYSSK
ncbi:MAG: hypothetical protein HQK54_17405 [Oligoflexales bacterium]|nr:hypothetical protein [Oligoflexales bacterium]